jgi:hypothetical protein
LKILYEINFDQRVCTLRNHQQLDSGPNLIWIFYFLSSLVIVVVVFLGKISCCRCGGGRQAATIAILRLAERGGRREVLDITIQFIEFHYQHTRESHEQSVNKKWK